ncbi:unnamed protein product [Rotaria magnacalcarata]|uniref:Uncharacterized protein n=1 Tax=Rotaria magnacalcarata TaxID=392030 RepID=A0A816QCQ1_9BILA|nr:unnamed protein product [Rotaria magnacalcarata]CAF2097115.1 unnamed protein product [Rotaria magnacalcarata]CAF4018922.1 unnamed protein product [Rotaria magnacalcarata]CAF4067553.1 unnamed protein product [Rotaria magnacalcarata]
MLASMIIKICLIVILLPYLCASIRCQCTCVKRNGEIVMHGEITRDPYPNECIRDSDCDPLCKTILTGGNLCTVSGTCFRNTSLLQFIRLLTPKIS